MTGIETHRSMVKAWECDSFGHFTVAYYFDRFADASATLLETLAAERGLRAVASWIPTEYHARFVSELRGGEVLHVESGVIAAEADRLRVGHRLMNSATGKVCTTVEELLQAKPGVAPLGDGERRRLAEPAIDWEESKNDPGFADGARDGLILTGRDRVKPAEVDESGELALPNYVHRSSVGCIQLLTAMGLPPEHLRSHHRGFSTFEIKLRLEPPGPKPGDALHLESGLMHLGSSSVRMVHRLHDSRSGRRVATLRQSGVHFDLEARRSTPIPEELRAKAAGLVLRTA
jgi:acyl-CoA thioesterase FadM